MPANLSVITLFCFIIPIVWGRPEGRIVGGKDALKGQFPYQVSLRELGKHFCGGSIISKNYILTAAHCVTYLDKKKAIKSKDPGNFNVLVGTVDRLRGGEVYPVASIKVHEGYRGWVNDIAILKLSKPLHLSENVQVINLASKETPPNKPVIVSGWGRLQSQGELAVHLQWNVLKSISSDACISSTRVFSRKLICLAHKEQNGACLGDSGGPAVYNGELIGVSGFIQSQCGTSLPDGYAGVFLHKQWIKDNTDLEDDKKDH